jgi:hypothetical protein
VLLKKDGEDQLDRSCEKCGSVTKSQGGVSYVVQTIKRRKVSWIGHSLFRNCLLEHCIEGKIEERKDKSDGKTRKKT